MAIRKGIELPNIPEEERTPQGKNGYVTSIGNDLFAWFKTTECKSRINFLELLRQAHTDYRVDELVLAYMKQQRVAQAPFERLRQAHRFPDQVQ